MKNNLESLEQKRRSLYERLEKMGDFRRGTISVNYRRCGKKNCVCAREGHPGHGPQFLWSTTIKGKSHTKQLKVGPELKKYLEENDNYRTFQRLCDEITSVSEKLSDLAPVPEIGDSLELEGLKKNLQKRFMGKYRKRWTG